MATSRYADLEGAGSTKKETPTGRTTTSEGGGGSQSGSQSSGGSSSQTSQSSTAGRSKEVYEELKVTDETQTRNIDENTVRKIDTQNMSPEAQASLQLLIAQLNEGGTAEQRRSKDNRNQTEQLIQGLLGAVSGDQALEDAKGLMALNLQQSLEKNMPAIQRSIEGAGTSASSMQGLLSQSLARDSALSAAALGGQQAAAYARERSNLAGVLEAVSRENNTVTESLIAALGIAKGAQTSTQEAFGRTVSDVTNIDGTVTTTGSKTTDTSSSQSGSSNTVTSEGSSSSTTTKKDPSVVTETYNFNPNSTNISGMLDTSQGPALGGLPNSTIVSGYPQFNPNTGQASGGAEVYKNRYGVYSDTPNR